MKNRITLSPKYFLSCMLLLSALALPSVSQAALNAYLDLTCDIQGKIDGSVTQSGRVDLIEVNAFGHNVSAPLDAASGLPTGKRQHRPLRILKPVDRSTPLLNLVLFTNENCTDATIRFWRPTATGAEEQYYTIQLLNARIISIMPTMAYNKVPENIQLVVSEVVSFTYQKITLTYEDGGITAEDDWSTSP